MVMCPATSSRKTTVFAADNVITGCGEQERAVDRSGVWINPPLDLLGAR